MTVHTEELTHHRQLRQEEIMEQIDVERATADELESQSEACLFEELMIIPKKHEDHREQQEHGQRMGQRSPFHPKRMPFDDIERTDNGQDRHHREEPTTIHQPLRLLPITVHDAAKEEEGEVAEHFHQTGVVEELILRSLMSQGPREIARQVACLEKTQRDDE